jgi:hypothetical protein
VVRKVRRRARRKVRKAMGEMMEGGPEGTMF